MEDQHDNGSEGATITDDNIASVREELSGGFKKANSLSDLGEPKEITPPSDQGGENIEESNTADSIGLSDDEKPSTDDASEDGGEASGEGNTDSTATPAETEDADSPFTTVGDEDAGEPATEQLTEEEEIDDAEYFTDLSDRIGYDVGSDEDVVSLVRQLSEKDPYAELSPLLKKVVEFESNGGDVREYFNVLSVDATSLNEKDAMWHKFKVENSSLAQENVDFARQKFERDFNTKYKILSDNRSEEDFDSEAEFQSFVKDKEYASLELKYEADQAKSSLTTNQEEALKTAPPQAQVNEEAQKEMYNKYNEEARYFKSNFDTLQIPIDDSGKTLYNIGLNEESRPIFEGYMDDPSSFLEEVGIVENTIDSERLTAAAALFAAFKVNGKNSVGAQFANAMTERNNKLSFETRLENPAPEGGKGTSGSASTASELEEAIDAFASDVSKRKRT